MNDYDQKVKDLDRALYTHPSEPRDTGQTIYNSNPLVGFEADDRDEGLDQECERWDGMS
jgi:hypothetical protein